MSPFVRWVAIEQRLRSARFPSAQCFCTPKLHGSVVKTDGDNSLKIAGTATCSTPSKLPNTTWKRTATDALQGWHSGLRSSDTKLFVDVGFAAPENHTALGFDLFIVFKAGC
jgi:hypothetical protein